MPFLQMNKPRWYIAYMLALLCLIFVYVAIIQHNAIQIGFDTLRYMQISERFVDSGNLDTLYDPIRTYGYPAFLAVSRLLSPDLLSLWAQGVIVLQLVLHVTTAALVAQALGKIGGLKAGWQWLGFVLVAFSVMLISLSQQILTETLSTFLITAFFTLIMSTPRRWKSLAAGAALGLLIVTRPFYFAWALALVVVLVCIWMLIRIVQRYRSSPPIQPRPLRWSIVVMFAAPLMFTVGLQMGINYSAEGRIGITGRGGSMWMGKHLIMANFYYKYETSIADDNNPQMNYFSSDRFEEYQNLTNPIQPFILDPLGTLAHFGIKTVGMFQSYELSPYRSHNDHNPLHITFINGFIFFVGFMYLSASVGLDALRKPALLLTRGGILWIAIVLHIFMYAIPTVPEPRFIAPVIPLIVLAALLVLGTRRDYRRLVPVVIISAVLFAISHQVIVANFHPHMRF